VGRDMCRLRVPHGEPENATPCYCVRMYGKDLTPY
jgi:hypothetical protein